MIAGFLLLFSRILAIALMITSVLMFISAIHTLVVTLFFPEHGRRLRDRYLDEPIFETFVDKDGAIVYFKSRRAKHEYYQKRKAERKARFNGWARSAIFHSA